MAKNTYSTILLLLLTLDIIYMCSMGKKNYNGHIHFKDMTQIQ